MKNHLLKSLLFLSMALCLVIPWAWAAHGDQPVPLVSADQIPDGPALVKGTAIDTRFSRTCYLTSRNGEALLFWVKNNGETDIRVAVNGQDPQILSPGQAGQVSVPLAYFTRSCLCQVTPVNEGDWLHIQYRIAQERSAP